MELDVFELTNGVFEFCNFVLPVLSFFRLGLRDIRLVLDLALHLLLVENLRLEVSHLLLQSIEFLHLHFVLIGLSFNLL